MKDDYAFALQVLDQLNGVEEFDLAYYAQRAERIREAADKHDVDSDKIFAVLADALRIDIKEHPNQERLEFLLQEGHVAENAADAAELVTSGTFRPAIASSASTRYG